MMTNAVVSIYVPVLTRNTEGEVVKSWGYKQTTAIAPAVVIDADVQPYKLSETELQLWGISDRNAQAKIMFCDYDINIGPINRAKVVDDFGTEYYDIKTLNAWATHCEAILVPVQGE